MKTRDEKGRFATLAESMDHAVEMTDEQREAIVYKSKLLNKVFDSWEELCEAEKAYIEAHKAEIKAKEDRKAAAEAVKIAIQERVEAQLEAKKAKRAAYEAYCQACDDADKVVNEKAKEEQAKLKEFCAKYPEGFHETIKIGDIEYRFDYSRNAFDQVSYHDPILRLFNSLF